MKDFVDNASMMFYLFCMIVLACEYGKQFINVFPKQQPSTLRWGVFLGLLEIFVSLFMFRMAYLHPEVGGLFIVIQTVFGFIMFICALSYFREATTAQVYEESPPNYVVPLRRASVS